MTKAAEELVYGQHAVAAVLASDPSRVLEVWLQRDRDTRLARDIQTRFAGGAVALHRLPRAQLDGLFPEARHQGVVVRARAPDGLDFKGLLARLPDHDPAPLLVVMDAVEDPHNLGAVLRTADAAGALAVLVPRSRGTGLTASARKVASGAAESVPVVQVANLARALEDLAQRGVRCVGAQAGAPTSLFDADLCGPLALVLGAEGRGLRALTARHCDLLVSLPMHGQVQSLNVSVSAGICLYEAVRQRRS